MSYQLYHFLRSKVFREVPFLRCYNHLSIYLVLISTTLPLFKCDCRKASQMLNTITPALRDRLFFLQRSTTGLSRQVVSHNRYYKQTHVNIILNIYMFY